MKKIMSNDPDIIGSFPALRRAARKARRLAVETGAPFIVMRRGKIVDANARKSSSPRHGRKKKIVEPQMTPPSRRGG